MELFYNNIIRLLKNFHTQNKGWKSLSESSGYIKNNTDDNVFTYEYEYDDNKICKTEFYLWLLDDPSTYKQWNEILDLTEKLFPETSNFIIYSIIKNRFYII